MNRAAQSAPGRWTIPLSWLDRRLPQVRMEDAEVQRQPERILAGASGLG